MAKTKEYMRVYRARKLGPQTATEWDKAKRQLFRDALDHTLSRGLDGTGRQRNHIEVLEAARDLVGTTAARNYYDLNEFRELRSIVKEVSPDYRAGFALKGTLDDLVYDEIGMNVPLGMNREHYASLQQRARDLNYALFASDPKSTAAMAALMAYKNDIVRPDNIGYDERKVQRNLELTRKDVEQRLRWVSK